MTTGPGRPATRTARAAPRHGAGDMAQFCQRMDELHQQAAPPDAPGRYQASTDGACLGNPDGPGGWAAIISALDQPERVWELWGHLASTSNNRAEVLGLLAALEWVPSGSTLLIRSDSEYTLKVLTGAYKAKANLDLWDAVRSTIASKRLLLQTEWVRGHAGDPGNERADALSVLGAVNGDPDRWAHLRSERARAPMRPRQPTPAAPPELDGVEPRGPWEQQFAQSLARQLRQGRPLSDKQRAVLERIRARGTSTA